MNSPRSRPLVVGLTGGIGSGKTTVCSLFADHGVEIIDADVIGRKLVAPGTVALQKIVDAFGSAILNADGSLNRPLLRDRIFRDGDARQALEELLHPIIRSTIVQQIVRSDSTWLILAAPLLLESNAYDFVDRVLVVDADESLQLARTAQRDHCSEEDVRRIMQAQLSRAERLARADDIIHNDGDMPGLSAQVDRLCQQYETLASERHQSPTPR